MSRSKSNNSKRFALIVTALAIFHFFALVSIGYATIIGVPGDYSLIQDAADNALDGDTILVHQNFRMYAGDRSVVQANLARA